MTSFADTALVAHYAERTARIVPGLHDLHRMACMLLAERAPSRAQVLVLGAGGGMELRAFAQMQPGWSFTGVDPSAEMLALARQAVEAFASRVRLQQGYVDAAPEGPFDAATCLLTLHFLPQEARRATLGALFQRLRPGAPLVVAHHSFPTAGNAGDTWRARCAAFAVASGAPASSSSAAMAAMKEHLPVLTPEQDVALLEEAGFVGVELFYAALSFKGWVARRP